MEQKEIIKIKNDLKENAEYLLYALKQSFVIPTGKEIDNIILFGELIRNDIEKLKKVV